MDCAHGDSLDDTGPLYSSHDDRVSFALARGEASPLARGECGVRAHPAWVFGSLLTDRR